MEEDSQSKASQKPPPPPSQAESTSQEGSVSGSNPRSGIVLEERSTERFGPVLIVKGGKGEVLHVQQAHNLSTQTDLGSHTETEQAIREIERQANLVAPTPEQSPTGGDQTFGFFEPLRKESRIDNSPKVSAEFSKDAGTSPGNIPQPETAAEKNEQQLTAKGKSSARKAGEQDSEGAPGMGLRSRPSTVTLESTERFGNVLVVKSESGELLGVFPKDPEKRSPRPTPLSTPRPEQEMEKAEKFSVLDTSKLSSPLPTIPSVSSKTKSDEAEASPEGDEHDEETEHTLSILRKFSETIPTEELYEFGDFRNMSWLKRTYYSIERDVYNWYGSFLSLINHGWGFESFITLLLAVGSTCFFCYYRTPDGTPLAARLDFSIIGSALVFPVTFLIAETFRRREGAIQRLASIKALLCQIELGLLTWRWKGPTTDLGQEWEERVHQTLHHVMNTMTAILRLPTWNTNRHIYTAQGREFKARVIKRERELTRRLGLLFSELHWYVEDLKEKGLPANEASRINQYNSLLQIDFEALAMVKSYRTPNVSRSFVRIMVTVMPVFYGPYFAWVSGSIGAGGQTNPAFAIALTVVTVFVLLGLVRVQRSMEDPFTSQFPGDVIDLISEQLDAETRLNLIVACARERKRAKATALANALAAQAAQSANGQ